MIRDAIESSPRVRRLIHMRTLHLGPDELLVAAKLEFDADLDLAQVARAIDAVEENVRARVPLARVIYLEPDIHRGDGEPQTAAQRQVSTDSVDSLKT